MISFPVASFTEQSSTNSQKSQHGASSASYTLFAEAFVKPVAWNYPPGNNVCTGFPEASENVVDCFDSLEQDYLSTLQRSQSGHTNKSMMCDAETQPTSGCSPSRSGFPGECFIEDSTSEGPSEESGDQLLELKDDKIQKFKANPINRSGCKKNWNPEDNDLLMKMALEYRNNWKRISKILLETKNIKLYPKVLRKIYEDLLHSKKVERAKFTHDDDLKIVKYLNKYGLDWNKIASHFSGKTPVMIKNRFYSYIKKRDLIDQLTAELEQLEPENENEEDQVLFTEPAQEGNLKVLIGEAEDLPIFNTTFHELLLLPHEDQLHERITDGEIIF